MQSEYRTHSPQKTRLQGEFQPSPRRSLPLQNRRSPSPKQYQAQRQSEQWVCTKCSIRNYNHRPTCFKCGISREESEATEAKDASWVGVLPCDTLFIRQLPSTATEEGIRVALGRYSGGINVQRVHISTISRFHAFIQLKSVDEAIMMLQRFQKVVPYIDKCPVIITYCTQSLNEIIVTEALLASKTISTREGKGTTSITTISNRRSEESPKRDQTNFVSTPFGQLRTYVPPNPITLLFEESTGYYFDDKTGFYYDPKSDYYFNPKTNEWSFWCTKYGTYINCEGGDLDLKRELQEEERDYQFRKLHQKQKTPSKMEITQPKRSGTAGLQDQHKQTIEHSSLFSTSSINQVEKPISGANNTAMQETLHSCLRQNMEMMDILREQLLAANDQRSIAMIQTQIETLLRQKQSIEQSLMELEIMVVPTNERKKKQQEEMPSAMMNLPQVTPKSKPHITQNILETHTHRTHNPRPPSVELLLDDAGGNRDNSNDNWRRAATTKRSSKTWRVDEMENALESKKTAFDKHVEQAEMLRQQRSEERGIYEHAKSGNRFDHLIDANIKTDRNLNAERFALAAGIEPAPNKIPVPPARQTGFEAQIRQMVDTRIIEQWRDVNIESGIDLHSNKMQHTSLSSGQKAAAQDHQSRHRTSRSRSPGLHSSQTHLRSSSRNLHHHRSRSPQMINVRDQDTRREDPEWQVSKRRSRRRKGRGRGTSSVSPKPPGVASLRPERISISPVPRQGQPQHEENWASSRMDGRWTVGNGLRSSAGGMPQMIPAIGTVDSAGMMMQMEQLGTGVPQQFFPPNNMIDSTSMLAAAQLQQLAAAGAGMIPQPIHTQFARTPIAIGGIPPIFSKMPTMETTPKQFFPSNDDHWRIARQQQHLPTALVQSNLQAQQQFQQQQYRTPIQPICSHCGYIGHLRAECPLEGTKRKFHHVLDVEKSNTNFDKRNIVEKERNELIKLNLCLNCGKIGHNQLACHAKRISDTKLQKKIRNIKERAQREEENKKDLLKKAEKYPVRRKDPFIQKLREVAPRGMITKQHIRSICTRCAGLNHSWNECARKEAPRSLHKEICRAMEEFTKVFFVHLNENNLVDFSEKFDLFTVMDAIENDGSIDPVGLQLQSICKNGVVTQGDLRKHCTRCADLGHDEKTCRERRECSRAHYEKMLTLVIGYKQLVKEGNGNFFLPNALQGPAVNLPVTSEEVRTTGSKENNKTDNETARKSSSSRAAEPIEEILVDDSTDEEQPNNAADEKKQKKTTTNTQTGIRQQNADEHEEDDANTEAANVVQSPYDWPPKKNTTQLL